MKPSENEIRQDQMLRNKPRGMWLRRHSIPKEGSCNTKQGTHFITASKSTLLMKATLGPGSTAEAALITQYNGPHRFWRSFASCDRMPVRRKESREIVCT